VKPIVRFERKDTSCKGSARGRISLRLSQGSQVRKKDTLTADLRRLTQIYAAQRSAQSAKRMAQSDKRRRTAGLYIFHTRETSLKPNGQLALIDKPTSLGINRPPIKGL